MIGSNMMNASRPTITHNGHSGDSPIIGQLVRDRYDRLWYHTAGRDRVTLSACKQAGIWRLCRVANALARDSASRHLLTTSPGRSRFVAMLACVRPSLRTVWRKMVEEA
jgi:hypothetical protein